MLPYFVIIIVALFMMSFFVTRYCRSQKSKQNWLLQSDFHEGPDKTENNYTERELSELKTVYCAQDSTFCLIFILHTNVSVCVSVYTNNIPL